MLNPQESNDYAVEFVKNCKRSTPNFDSTQQPFIMGNPVENGMIDTRIEEVNQIFEKLPLHNSLKKIYQVIGNPEVEYYYGGDWTLLSLKKMKSIYEKYVINNQRRAVDFAMIYAGMGHVVVVTYDPVTDKIYYRHSGGANGYEQDYNYKFALQYEPKENELYDITHWFDIIKKEGIDAFSLPLISMY